MVVSLLFMIRHKINDFHKNIAVLGAKDEGWDKEMSPVCEKNVHNQKFLL